jgi:hypothetical protein
MDLLYFLAARLQFIEDLYDPASDSFEKTKRKIAYQWGGESIDS